MSNPADFTTGASVQVKDIQKCQILLTCTSKKYNKYESLSVYQVKNVKSWLTVHG